MTPELQDDKTVDVTARRKNRLLIAFAVWMFFIFGTSCTVIRPLEFFQLIQRFTGAQQESMERFALFWGIAWFAVVKGWHFTEFAILTFLCTGAVSWWRGTASSMNVLIAMLFCVVFAVSDEWHQTFIPDRFGTVQDVWIDSLGVLSAGAYILARQRRKEHQKS